MKHESRLLSVADPTLDTRAFRVRRGTTLISLQPRGFACSRRLELLSRALGRHHDVIEALEVSEIISL